MKHTHTKIKNDNDYLWFWVAIELDNNSILDILSLLAERNMFVGEFYSSEYDNQIWKESTFYRYAAIYGIWFILLCL